jgi:deoxyribodipyrimidine photo-lyase
VPALPALPPVTDRDAVLSWVAQHLGRLVLEGPDAVRPGGLTGGQTAADAALAGLDLTGYASRRSTVDPPQARAATRLSPYVRHGLLQLPGLWASVAGQPPRDRRRFRDQLLWQEYARHLYARTGRRLGQPLRHRPPAVAHTGTGTDPWTGRMSCVREVHDELVRTGWLVNQTRMWLSSHWTVRHGADWQDGEDEFFRHLLDGSRAANRLGWQWTVGTATGRPYGFSRWQVQKRAPALCARCELRQACPIEDWPAATAGPRVAVAADLTAGPTEAGPLVGQPTVHGDGPTAGRPDSVWLTAESLGDADPALAAHPGLPAVFVFDAPLLTRLRLSGKRLVFMAEALADLADRRPVQVRLGVVADELAGRRLAATYAPVPGWSRIAEVVRPVVRHPWPWLVRPAGAPLTSFTAWRSRASPPQP